MTVRRPATLLAIAGAAAALTACASPELVSGPALPTEHYKPIVTQAPEQIALGIHSGVLSMNQRAALSDFVGRWRDNGGGPIVVKAPVNGGDQRFARREADATLSTLIRLGVPADHVRLAGYDAGHAPGAPVLASFDRFEVVNPDCSRGWSNLTSTGSNQPYATFGCAVTANLAQMVANPRDLIAPAATDPADNSRRQIVLGKYRQGTTTSTAADSQASGSVSGSQ